MRASHKAVVLPLLVLCWGCEGDSDGTGGSPELDGGAADSGGDVGAETDAGSDVEGDAGEDSGTGENVGRDAVVDGGEDVGGGGTGTCSDIRFTEIDPEHGNEAFRTRIEEALRLLCESETDEDIGFLTYASIANGLVLIDQLEDLTPMDFRSACFFAGVSWEGVENGAVSRDRAMGEILAVMNGYMWGNRIYLNLYRGRPVEDVVATIAHETNHILNRSDENYYLPMDREVSEEERIEILNSLVTDPDRAFVEEYRAFYIEEVMSGSPLNLAELEDLRWLKEAVVAAYGWDEVDVDAYPDFPTGILVPDDAGWAARPPSMCGPELIYFPCE